MSDAQIRDVWHAINEMAKAQKETAVEIGKLTTEIRLRPCPCEKRVRDLENLAAEGKGAFKLSTFLISAITAIGAVVGIKLFWK
jgi:hypothetical protein